MGFFEDLFLPEPLLRFINNGIYFTKDSNVIPWSSVCAYESDDEKMTITFWGGLEVMCGLDVSSLQVADDFSGPNLDRDDLFYDFSKDSDSLTMDDIRLAIKTLQISMDVLDLIAKTDSIKPGDDPYILTNALGFGYNMMFMAMGLTNLSANNDISEFLPFFQLNLTKIAAYHQKSFKNFPSIAEALASDVGDFFKQLCVVMDVVAGDEQCYQWHHNYSIYGEYNATALKTDLREEINDVFVNKRALLVRDPDRRKIICCTDKPIEIGQQDKYSKDFMVLIPREIGIFNELVEQDCKLLFQPGHPRNGCTYVQHPFRKNVYFEVNSYHDSLRERKQNELLRILEALGAYSARVEVRHEQLVTANFGHETHLATNGSYGIVSASGSRNMSGERQTSMSSSQSATKDWTFNPPEKPYLPDDLVFYPTEETWQQLANSVLRGGLKRAVVDLEYKSEYGITEKYLSDIAASARLLIPSFDMNLSKSFSSNLHRLTTTQWHYEVIFENETGERAGGEAKAASQITSAPPNTDANKVELLFSKRARRYAQSEGHINAEQRADLEAFAQKYGIDEFRMEELIEEAFE